MPGNGSAMHQGGEWHRGAPPAASQADPHEVAQFLDNVIEH